MLGHSWWPLRSHRSLPFLPTCSVMSDPVSDISQDAGPLPSRVLGADDLFPILCFIVARGADLETTRPSHTRLTTLLAWCSSMADGGGGEGEWMAQSMRSALTLLIENASVATQVGTAS